MNRPSKLAIDILIAIAISLVINFSHLLLIFLEQDPQQSNYSGHSSRVEAPDRVQVDGLFRLHPDGHGYLIYNRADSAYLSQGKVSRYSLKDSDTLSASVVLTGKGSLRHPVVHIVVRRNGNPITPYASSTVPQKRLDFALQLLYYFALSLIIILLATSRRRRNISRSKMVGHVAIVLCVAVVLYLFAPLVSPRQRGEFIFNLLLRNRPIIDLMVTLKWSFAVIVSVLYSQIHLLTSQRQNIILENEQLRSENINAQYNMLMSQINPHFFFNSLNSLSMLVRERDEQRSLTYIDQLSYTFRYILQNRESTLTTLANEMEFVEAYIYLFKIRYADKLFFDIDIDPRYNNYQIPALSLQPLLDNAVKHNTIISSRPFHVSITVDNGVMIISNAKYPKLEPEPSTGVGLENLSRRWMLIANCPIEIVQDDNNFSVKLPLLAPTK